MSSLNDNAYCTALNEIDALMRALTDIRPVIESAAEAQKTGDDFDIICDGEEDSDSELFSSDKNEPAAVPPSSFPNLKLKTDYGPN